MSFATIRPYFQERMKAVDPDFREWEDAFNINNIPSSILDKSWHLDFSTFSYNTGGAHLCLSFDCPISLSVVFKGYRAPSEAVDMAMLFADSIIKECTKPTHRLTQPKIKNVLPSSVSVRELSDSNDNSAVLEIQFSCEVIIGS